MTSSILHTDVLAAFKTMPDNSYHGCLTDPPYGLSFMGHGWDHGVPSVDVWRELLRVLRPGAHVLAFGGTRTFHRLTCAIEDAGFEVRDCMMWLYGSGFPKSHDVSKAIDREAAPATEAARQYEGHGTALKPAWEPIIVARKPLDGTVAQNVQRWGCGALAIDASRVGHDEPTKTASRTAPRYSGRTMANGARGGGPSAIASADPLGRWPANVILDEAAGAMLDAQTEGTSRFFYQAKASRAERDAGLDEPNVHPTVKPLALARYLARLILPPIDEARMVVPFCGSGSEVIGALQAGWAHVDGIDSWDVAVDIARARVEHWSK